MQNLNEQGIDTRIGKHISLCIPGQRKAIRTHNLGSNYTRDAIIEKIITNVCGTFIPLLNFFQKPFLSFSTTFCISLKSPLNLLCDILVEGDIFLKASC